MVKLMNKREKVYLLVIIIALSILTFKSLVLDDLDNLTENEAAIVEKVYVALDKEYDGFLYDYSILSVKIIKIQKEEENHALTVRKYLLKVLPIYQYKIRTEFKEGSS